jgi:ATP-dependent protease ClpP protease subunit
VALRIRSDGGDFIASLAMREVIISRLGQTIAYVDGLAASAATLVACACTKIVMGVGAKFMIHEASASMQGRANDFEHAADELRKTNDTIARIYSERWNGTPEELRKALREETWYDAYEAVAVGLADEVSEKLSAAAMLTRDFGYKSIPSQLAIAAKASDCPRRMASELMFHRLATVR